MDNRTVPAYQHDADGFFLGMTEADESPLEPGVFLVPALCTLTPPPAEVADLTNSAPTAETVNAAAAVGTASTAARADHRHAMPAEASTTASGFMSAADKLKLDGIQAGAQSNTVTSVAGRTGAVTLAVADISGAAPLDSPAMTGIPTRASTPTRHDRTTSIANTIFVMEELGNLSTAYPLTIDSPEVLPTSYTGRILQIAGPQGIFTKTLPSAPTVRDGDTFYFSNTPLGPTVTLNTYPGIDNIRLGNNFVTSLTIFPGEYLVISCVASSHWVVIGGDVSLRYSPTFSSSISSNGYQKLPTGLILQWGAVTNSSTPGAPTSVTFPIAFPHAVMSLQQTVDSGTTSFQSAWYDFLSTTGFNSRASAASVVSRYFAIGN